MKLLLVPVLALLMSTSALATAATTGTVAPARIATTTAPAAALTESQKINGLIGSIEHLPGAVFIRNGSEYDSKAAAAHLRMKWNYAGRRIKTAEDFIRYCATKSSMSGKKYRIRFADGHSVDSEQYFQQQLQLLEGHARAGVAARK